MNLIETIVENDFISELKNHDSVLFKQALPIQSFSLAPYVNHSLTLQNLVKLGVSLHEVEVDTNIASFLAKADFKEHIQPIILFLHHNDIPADELGHVFTKNPAIFQEPLEKLQLRVDYLASKRFSREAIARLVSKVPSILTTSTILTDQQLGFLQLKFKLTGDEVRSSVTKYPRIIICDSELIESNYLSISNTLGFDASEIKGMYLQDPRLFMSGQLAVASRFDYLHNQMGFSHEDLAQFPQGLRTRLTTLQERYTFLKFLNRIQFDPFLPNYISLLDFCTANNLEFTVRIAKTTPRMFNDFLKTQ